jgi:L-ascorbate metabolism protein UlaG (beta-lactamase superfamily)
MKRTTCCKVLVAFAFTVAAGLAAAQNVKVTPLGTHTGELCGRDRATLFEDPSGVRILYDAGQSLTGADDPRLGDVHVVLLSHAHSDHIGDQKLAEINAGSCAQPKLVAAGANSVTAEIIAAKNSAMMIVRELGLFIDKRVATIRGKPSVACAQSAGSTTVPLAAPCLAVVELGGSQLFKTAAATRSVEITVVQAAHASNPPRSMLTDAGKASLVADELAANVGPATGYVITFTNGLRVYLSGDTALHTEMRTVVRDFHKANLAVMNLGPNAISPQAAAYAMNELVRPATVIASHPNEGVTSGGKLIPNTRTATFINLIRGRAVYPALSGKTMEFDGNAKCVAAC